ncbi:MAG: hypothetical protein CENE_00877 [Candidatus Celerinatantimonas neptuna]|nr:MAG: hypothetical protein CENE_00877 [Candidatus Celerinatantimonas neptuna]
MTPNEFTCLLANTESVTVIFEACGTSNYWKQLAASLGHDARLISPKLVDSVRQNKKTDKNDTLAIVQASLLPDVAFISGKTIEQQQLQSVMRLRELSIRQKTAAKNQLTALLSKFNIKVSLKHGGLRAVLRRCRIVRCVSYGSFGCMEAELITVDAVLMTHAWKNLYSLSLTAQSC